MTTDGHHRSEESFFNAGPPPASGERAALSGYVPQYEVAAGLLLRALTEETLDWVALMDPEAGRLDDFQLATPGRLDAYQIKWSQSGGQVRWSDLMSHLVDLVSDRRRLASQHPDLRVVAHLHMDRVASNTRLSNAPHGQAGATGANAIVQLLIPATEGAFESIDALPTSWTWLWRELAERCGLTDDELLSQVLHVRIELGKELPSSVERPERTMAAYQRDIDDLMVALLRLAIDPRQVVHISRERLLEQLGIRWQQRLELRSVHEFPTPMVYEASQSTVQHLNEAINRFNTGYVALIGTPGSGKSTLLTHELRGRVDVVARYYAYVRGRTDIGPRRAEASGFLHDLVLTLERGGLPRSAVPVDFEVSALTDRLERQLSELGDRYQQDGRRSIILVDGLDHVERAQGVEQSMLHYLPGPESLPEGVMFVLGGQSVRMVDSDIRTQLAESGRTVVMRGLSRAEVAQVVDGWNVAVDPGRLWELSDGHPLILTYLLQELRDLPRGEQEDRLTGIPSYAGDVEQLYSRLWTSVEEHDDLVELLGLVSRMRGSIDLGWLRARGQPSSAVRRLSEHLAHLFRRETDRWYFFHESFRLFLEDRTCRVGDESSPAEHRRIHGKLAEMCRDTSGDEARSWEVLFHLAAAAEHEEVLATATPEFFRKQLLALRPPERVEADIRLAVRSLAYTHDPMGLVRLTLAAGEASQRSYNSPDREEFFSLLVLTGQPKTALDHMEVEREQFGVEDSRTARLRVALLLHDHGRYEDARVVLEANEPWDLLSGEAESRQLRGPYELLYSWARAAAVLRSPETVRAAAESLRLPPDDQALGDEQVDRSLRARAWMLASAADELERRGQRTEADRILESLDPYQREDRRAWLWALSQRWNQHGQVDTERLNLVVSTMSPQDLDPMQRVVVAEGLWRDGQQESAQQWIEHMPQPPLSDAMGTRDLWDGQVFRYRLNRLLAAFGRHDDPESVLPAPGNDHQWGRVFAGRIAMSIAQLQGRAWAGEALSVTEFMTAARRVLRTLDVAARGHWSRRYEAAQVRPHALAQLLVVADQHGRDPVQALWEEYCRRWDDHPEELRRDGQAVLPEALTTRGIVRAAVLDRLSEMEEIVRAGVEPGEGPREMTELARTFLEAGREQDAKRLLHEAVNLSLAVYHRKDYQLSDWIDLLGPRLDGESGAALVRWLAGAIAQLRETEAPVTHAARRLLFADGTRRPGHSWGVGAWLEAYEIVDWDDRIGTLLKAQVELAADQSWWTALAELLAPISPNPPVNVLEEAGSRAVGRHNIAWLRRQLRVLINIAEVEAPPHVQDSWRFAIADCAAVHGVQLSELGLPEPLHPNRRPPRSWSRGTGEDQRDAFLEDHQTVSSLLAAARDGNLSDLDTPWAEAVSLVAPQMSVAELQEASQIFSSGHQRLSIQIRLARRAQELDAPDVAAELAEQVVTDAEPRSWLRNWDRGPLMEAFRLLAELDPQATRDRAYRRFASDAASETYLLTEVSRELTEFLDLFGADDTDAIGREVEGYLRVIVGEVRDLPDADISHATEDAAKTLVRAGLDLLAYPYRLSVTTAQRGLVRFVLDGDAAVFPMLADALAVNDEEFVLRLLSVLDTAVEQGAQLSDEVADALLAHAASNHLSVRLNTRQLVATAGRVPDPLPSRSLPTSYSLSIPDRDTSRHQGGQPLGRDDLDTLLIAIQGKLDRLARASGVDPGVLHARVSVLARRYAGEEPVADSRWQTSNSPFGWAYHKPSVALFERAAAHAAAELADADRVEPELAMLFSTGPSYDPRLISTRPAARPDEVGSAEHAGDETWINTDNWLDGLAGADERLAVAMADGWVVIGEHTELRRLDRSMPREMRTQCLGPHQYLTPDTGPDQLRLSRLAELDEMGAGEAASPLIYHWDPSYRGASAWLTLHPRLAEACSWERDPDVLVGWRDTYGEVVKSIWWRSGWLDSTRTLEKEEVGEGWLVLAKVRARDVLIEMIGGELGVAWKVSRDFMVAGEPSRADSGVRPLVW